LPRGDAASDVCCAQERVVHPDEADFPLARVFPAAFVLGGSGFLFANNSIWFKFRNFGEG
jgi:hypothetical protein